MSELQKLIEDYYKDMNTMAETMLKWCEPTQEVITKIKKMRKTAIHGSRAIKQISKTSL